MKMVKKGIKKEVLGTLIFSLCASIALILHGIFFDLDFSQISRLTIEGFILTFILTFLGLLILERIFTFEENKEIISLKKRLDKIEKIKH